VVLRISAMFIAGIAGMKNSALTAASVIVCHLVV
jgi:hypothetical protein